jgi:hypothetical protein
MPSHRPRPGRTPAGGAGSAVAQLMSFLCLITPLCSYLYGGLYGGLCERAHIIRCFTARRQAESEGVAEGRVRVRPQRLEPGRGR